MSKTKTETIAIQVSPDFKNLFDQHLIDVATKTRVRTPSMSAYVRGLIEADMGIVADTTEKVA